MKVAISYRRTDDPYAAYAIKTALSKFINDVVLDVSTFEVGANFPNELHQHFSTCDVLLAIIGNNWQEERLSNDSDWVRKELSLALTRMANTEKPVKVIPVLIDRQSMPILPDDLPYEFREFTMLGAHQIRRATIEQDIESLKTRIFSTNFINIITATETMGLIHAYKSFSDAPEAINGQPTKYAPQQQLVKYASSTRELKILQTWTPRLALVEAALQEALTHDATVKLLYLSPHSESLRSRVEGLGDDIDDVHNTIDYTIRQLKRFLNNAHKANARGTLEIRFYDLMPSLQLHLCDQAGFIGFFLRGVNASRSIQLEIMDVFGVDTPVFDLAHAQFNSIWTDKKTTKFDLQRYCDDKYPFDGIEDYMRPVNG